MRTAKSTTSTGHSLEKSQVETTNPLVSDFDDELLSAFKIEAEEQLDIADQYLMVLESSPNDASALNAVFRAFHTIKGNAGFLNVDPMLGNLAHDAETVFALCREGRMSLEGSALELSLDSSRVLRGFLQNVGRSTVFTETSLHQEAATLRHRLKQLAAGDTAGVPTPPEKEGAFGKVAEDSRPAPESATAPALRTSGERPTATDAHDFFAASTQSSLPPTAEPFHAKAVSCEPKEVADCNAAVGAAPPDARPTNAPIETLRVDRARLDILVELIGELVIAESMAQQDAIVSSTDSSVAPERSRNLAQLNRITRTLQELSLSLRMVPLRSTFQKMTRVARDLMRKLDKNVDFVVEGEHTELDKTVVDEIGDPLMHMVRNAIDHGIEFSPEERIANGKNAKGRVVLRAFHQSGNIHIEIQDDGRGLNVERILAKAKAQKLIAEDAAPSESEILALIFEPGFSTAEKVTDVSGRGVGMDVVRRNIQALRGSIDIKTKYGEGSCFTIRMPLTLAIIDGLVVRSGSGRFVIPTLSVMELMQLNGARISTITEKHSVVTVRDQNVPLVELQRLLGLPRTSESNDKGIIVVVQDGPHSAALVVDEVLGQQQVVIKQLGHNMDRCKVVSGGAIMPDGQVGIILDIHGIIAQSRGKA